MAASGTDSRVARRPRRQSAPDHHLAPMPRGQGRTGHVQARHQGLRNHREGDRHHRAEASQLKGTCASGTWCRLFVALAGHCFDNVPGAMAGRPERYGSTAASATSPSGACGAALMADPTRRSAFSTHDAREEDGGVVDGHRSLTLARTALPWANRGLAALRGKSSEGGQRVGAECHQLPCQCGNTALTECDSVRARSVRYHPAVERDLPCITARQSYAYHRTT